MLGYFIIGGALLIALMIGGQALANAKPSTILRTVRVAALIALGSGAIFFGLTGRLQIASGLAFAALFFLRNKPLFSASKPSAGQTSTVKTDWLEAELDHDTGDMDALITRGIFDGRKLSSLELEELEILLEELTIDQQSHAIVQAYIERNHSGEDTGGQDESTNTSDNTSGIMSKAEAYEILELKPGATLSEIKTAHKNMMKKFHPDHNGSTYMAAKINQARDLLTKP